MRHLFLDVCRFTRAIKRSLGWVCSDADAIAGDHSHQTKGLHVWLLPQLEDQEIQLFSVLGVLSWHFSYFSLQFSLFSFFPFHFGCFVLKNISLPFCKFFSPFLKSRFLIIFAITI